MESLNGQQIGIWVWGCGLSNGTMHVAVGVKRDLDKRGQRSPKVGQRNNSETLRDRAKVSIKGKYEIGYGLSNGTIAVDPGVKIFGKHTEQYSTHSNAARGRYPRSVERM